MKRSAKISSVAVIAGLVVGAGAVAANAGTVYQNFQTTVPRYQQSNYLAYQNKTFTNANANLYMSDIGSNYLMNGKVQNSSFQQGAELKGMNEGYTYAIPAPFPSNLDVRMVLTNNTYAVVNVGVTGRWRSN